MSGTTMSLSGARPILIEPGGVCTVRPGCRIFSMLVARLLVLECGAAAGAIDVAHSAAGAEIGCGTGAERVGWLGFDWYADGARRELVCDPHGKRGRGA